MPYPKSIYPEPTSATPLRTDERDPRRDGCPQCMKRDNAPVNVRYTNTGYYATYRCTCGHSWWTGWAYEPVEVVAHGA